MLVPKLRFKREDGTEFPEWEEKTFEETFIPLNNNTFSRDMLNNESGTVQNIHYGDILVKYGAICDVKKISLPFVNTDIATKKYDIMKNGDIIIADTAEDTTVGKAIELIGIDNDIIISGLHTMACRPKQKYAPKFLGYLINSPAYHNQLFPYMQGIKVTSVGRKNIANTKLYYPCLEEQQKIADFLSTVDEVISQSEAEVKNLEQQKKGAMQKIFSQEVRFRREDGTEFPEWEDCILSDYCKELKTTIEPKKRPNDSFLEYSMPAFDLDKKPSKVFGNDMNSSRKVINTCCVLINKLNVRKKRIWKVINPDNNSVCSAEFIPVTSDAISLDFLEHLALSERFTSRLLDCSTGTSNSQKRVTPNIIMDMPVSIPHIEEQQKIADFLSAYDEAITYAKQELDKWKELKKGLLQQMFV